MEKQTVSGWCTPEVRACVNQVWNCVKGDGCNWWRERLFLVYWSAWKVVLVPAGATVAWGMGMISYTGGEEEEKEDSGRDGDVQMSFESFGAAMLEIENERTKFLNIELRVDGASIDRKAEGTTYGSIYLNSFTSSSWSRQRNCYSYCAVMNLIRESFAIYNYVQEAL